MDHLNVVLLSQLKEGLNLLAGPNNVPHLEGIYVFQVHPSVLLWFQLVVYLSLGPPFALLLGSTWMSEPLRFRAVCFQQI